MRTIRSVQLAAIAKAVNRPFVTRLAEDIRQIFPEQWAQLGDERVREEVEAGLERAPRYGLTTQREVAQFVVLMFSLDLDFDTAPGFAWAQEILHDLRRDPQERLDQIADLS